MHKHARSTQEEISSRTQGPLLPSLTKLLTSKSPVKVRHKGETNGAKTKSMKLICDLANT
eukprot:3727829-Amphidinium_carterae.1